MGLSQFITKHVVEGPREPLTAGHLDELLRSIALPPTPRVLYANPDVVKTLRRETQYASSAFGFADAVGPPLSGGMRPLSDGGRSASISPARTG